ncbi:hypothetical protein VKT23_004362 [Stygiomarasmius scandens]|uniref:Uncharacterized protein n=1 Tax=Marasmiellus scandens TaxID=2682957 RepID=A0ABR1JUF9_9AGAR
MASESPVPIAIDKDKIYFTPSSYVQPTEILYVIFRTTQVYLTLRLPIFFIMTVCLKPIRWLMFVGRITTNVEGEVSLDNDPSTESTLPIDADSIDGAQVYYYVPKQSVNVTSTVDSEMSRAATRKGDHANLSENSRGNMFKDRLGQRDGERCIFTGRQSHHKHHGVPIGLSPEWVYNNFVHGRNLPVVEDLAEKNPINPMDNPENGFSISPEIHSGITVGDATILCLRNDGEILRPEHIPGPNYESAGSKLAEIGRKLQDNIKEMAELEQEALQQVPVEAFTPKQELQHRRRQLDVVEPDNVSYILQFLTLQGSELRLKEINCRAVHNVRAKFTVRALADQSNFPLPDPDIGNYIHIAQLIHKFQDYQNSISREIFFQPLRCRTVEQVELIEIRTHSELDRQIEVLREAEVSEGKKRKVYQPRPFDDERTDPTYVPESDDEEDEDMVMVV